MPTLVDSHCHLQSLAEPARTEAVEEAREAGVRGFLIPATKLEEAEEILAFCHRHDDVVCALGVHPHEASSWRRGDERRLAELLADPRAVAVGECGLDFHYDHAPREAQLAALRAQWRLALELDLPVVVHNRESDDAMLAEVRRPEFAGLRGDFHSFAGGLAMGRELLERGFYLGVTGMVTFKAAENIREIVRATPLDRLLVETDTPYLAPVPHRGKPNRPAWVVEVAHRAAEVKAVPFAELARATTAGYRALFAV